MAEWLRSTSIRVSLAFALLMIAAFLIAGALIWNSLGTIAERQIRQRIELEVAAIHRELRAEGLQAAIGAIESRAERPGAFEYLLTDSRGRRLVGDLEPLDDGRYGWRRVELEGTEVGAEGAQSLLALTERLERGYRLTVGEDLSRSASLQAAILRYIAIVGGATVLAALLAGALVARGTLRRIDRLNATIEAVGRGDLGARYETSRTPTDIDDIGAGINVMLERIEGLIRNIQRVSRDVAHDLRTPLTRLRQRLEAGESPEACAAPAGSTAAALSDVDDIIRMFDATLRLAEIDAGRVRQRFRSVELASVAANVVDAYRPDVEESGRRLSTSRLDPGRVSGDASLLMQALANLIENAMRHTPPGTEIDVCIIAEGTTTSLVVVDNGCGIPEGARAEALEPFSRLDGSRMARGSGLGLSIVAAVARAHGATLDLSDARPGLRVSLRWRAL
ncbi:MAG: ATP-binding protein [Pseudomonadales bacterium]|jgi:signal transduction histidine kinase